MLEKQLKIINRKNKLKAMKAELKGMVATPTGKRKARIYMAAERANLGLLQTSNQ
jgi:hypothetical protein